MPSSGGWVGYQDLKNAGTLNFYYLMFLSGSWVGNVEYYDKNKSLKIASIFFEWTKWTTEWERQSQQPKIWLKILKTDEN